MSLLRNRCVVVSLLLWAGATVLHGAADVQERQLKAATIVSMLRLVTWQSPAPTPAPLAIVVIGDTALASALRDASAGQRVDGRALSITQVGSLAQLPDTAPPVIVLAEAQRASAPALARSMAQKPVLTIGEGDRMGEAGLVIGVYVDGHRIRFDANTAAASRAGLSLSSHLLRLARIVG